MLAGVWSRVRGRVQDGAGAPVEGATVLLTPPLTPQATREPYRLFGARGSAAATTLTDAQGEFGLEVPEPGLWRVWAGLSGNWWQTSEPFPPTSLAGPT